MAALWRAARRLRRAPTFQRARGAQDLFELPLPACRSRAQQPAPSSDDLRLLLKRPLPVQETAAGDWEFRVPLLRRWLRERT